MDKLEPPYKIANRATLDLFTARDVLWLHKRMGHPSRATIYQAIMNGAWTGLPTNITPAQVNKTLKNIHCLSCGLSNRNRDPTKEGDGFHAPSPGDEISVDYQGKINPPSIRGFTASLKAVPHRYPIPNPPSTPTMNPTSQPSTSARTWTN